MPARALAAGIASSLDEPLAQLVAMLDELDETDDIDPQQLRSSLDRVRERLHALQDFCNGVAAAERPLAPTGTLKPVERVIGEVFVHDGAEFALVSIDGKLECVRASALKA